MDGLDVVFFQLGGERGKRHAARQIQRGDVPFVYAALQGADNGIAVFIGKNAEHGERALGGQGVQAAGKGAGGMRVVRHV